MTTPETITRDELAEALRGLKITPEDENTFYPAVADAIFEKAKRNREPEYEPGAMYQDADGKFWLYSPDRPEVHWADCPWVHPGSAGAYSLNSPERPLRKLVPEGSQAQMDGLDGEALDELLKRAGLSDKQAAAVALDIHRIFEGNRP